MIIYLKRLKSSKFVRVKASPMYGGIGVSAPSLHRESTDSLIEATYFDDFTNRGVCTCQPELLEEVEEQGCCLETFQDYFAGLFPDYDPRALYDDNRPEGCNNSPLGNSSVSLVSTITTTTAVIIAFMLALGYP